MTHKGFTLLETILYLALLSMLMTGTLTCVYQLIESQTKLSVHTNTEEESLFVLQKLAWATSNMATISIPSTLQTRSTQLTFLTNSNQSIIFRYNTAQKSIEMSSDSGNTFVPITTNAVQVSALQFLLLPSRNGSLMGVEASTTIDGVTIYFKKFLSV